MSERTLAVQCISDACRAFNADGWGTGGVLQDNLGREWLVVFGGLRGPSRTAFETLSVSDCFLPFSWPLAGFNGGEGFRDNETWALGPLVGGLEARKTHRLTVLCRLALSPAADFSGLGLRPHRQRAAGNGRRSKEAAWQYSRGGASWHIPNTLTMSCHSFLTCASTQALGPKAVRGQVVHLGVHNGS